MAGSETAPSVSTQARDLTAHRRALPALTGVRFLAAWYVVLFHAYPGLARRYPLPKSLEIFLSNGYLAVGLFFVLSGFILAYTYDGQIDGWSNRRRFWDARFARIYPVYLLGLILSLKFAGDLHLGTRVAVLGMVQAWNPINSEMAGAWNYPAWSLSVEAFFYVCFPFVLPWLCRRSNRALAWLTPILLAVCVLGWTPVKGLGEWKEHGNLLVQYAPLPVLRLPEFLVGVVLGLRFLRTIKEPASPKPVLRSLLVYSAVIATVLTLALPLGGWVSFVIVPFSILVYELALGESLLARFLSTRFMVLLGGASYAVYLLRFPITSWTRLWFSSLSGSAARAGEFAGPLLLVVVSIVVFLYWEEPSRKTLRRWFSGGKQSQRKPAVTPTPAPAGELREPAVPS
jgi:peptidoglycan/LPS O-acetylase OafA/YrhL